MEPPDNVPRRSLLARVFLSPDERRLRAGWRLLLQAVLLIVLTVVIGLAALLVASATAPGGPGVSGISGSATGVLLTLLQLLAITGSVYLARRLLDHRSFRSLGLGLNRRAYLDLAFGIVVAGFLMGLIYVAEALFGWLRFEAFAWERAAPSRVLVETATALLVFVLVGWQEELLCRGYWLQNICAGLNLAWSVVLSSLGFALLHLQNPNVSPAAIGGLLGAGLFLALGYVLTRQLWLPIGIHIGWNSFEGTVFGFPVSGTDGPRLILQRVSGPELLTGGAFGPEAGLIVLPAMAVGSALVYLYARRFTPPRAPC